MYKVIGAMACKAACNHCYTPAYYTVNNVTLQARHVQSLTDKKGGWGDWTTEEVAQGQWGY